MTVSKSKDIKKELIKLLIENVCKTDLVEMVVELLNKSYLEDIEEIIESKTSWFDKDAIEKRIVVSEEQAKEYWKNTNKKVKSLTHDIAVEVFEPEVREAKTLITNYADRVIKTMFDEYKQKNKSVLDSVKLAIRKSNELESLTNKALESLRCTEYYHAYIDESVKIQLNERLNNDSK